MDIGIFYPQCCMDINISYLQFYMDINVEGGSVRQSLTPVMKRKPIIHLSCSLYAPVFTAIISGRINSFHFRLPPILCCQCEFVPVMWKSSIKRSPLARTADVV